MKPQQAIDQFGGRGALAGVLGVSEAAVHLWVKQGWIPYDRQCHIQVESARAGHPIPGLQASWDDVPDEKRKVAA